MARDKTNKIKKIVMSKIADTLNDVVTIDRKRIKTKDKLILAWASKDYPGESRTGNWYGILSEEIENLDLKNTFLLFTTGDIKHFLLIPANEFEKNIKSFLRKTDTGYFFLFRRDNQGCYLPKGYIPLNLREGINERGLNLDKYVNNLSLIGSDYKYYSQEIKQKNDLKVVDTDILHMIKVISEKDPLFFAKSIEEKLVIIRYNQLENDK